MLFHHDQVKWLMLTTSDETNPPQKSSLKKTPQKLITFPFQELAQASVRGCWRVHITSSTASSTSNIPTAKNNFKGF